MAAEAQTQPAEEGETQAVSPPTLDGPGGHGFPAEARAGRAGESRFISGLHCPEGRGSGVHLLPSEAVRAG